MASRHVSYAASRAQTSARPPAIHCPRLPLSSSTGVLQAEPPVRPIGQRSPPTRPRRDPCPTGSAQRRSLVRLSAAFAKSFDLLGVQCTCCWLRCNHRLGLLACDGGDASAISSLRRGKRTPTIKYAPTNGTGIPPEFMQACTMSQARAWSSLSTHCIH